ncbi:MAG TPA: hypothetical protein VFL57_03755 [Bryobacteraceae bacterium]|nr:hypothetical protein [Bryobacteraceae bacterium]
MQDAQLLPLDDFLARAQTRRFKVVVRYRMDSAIDQRRDPLLGGGQIGRRAACGRYGRAAGVHTLSGCPADDAPKLGDREPNVSNQSALVGGCALKDADHFRAEDLPMLGWVQTEQHPVYSRHNHLTPRWF